MPKPDPVFPERAPQVHAHEANGNSTDGKSFTGPGASSDDPTSTPSSPSSRARMPVEAGSREYNMNHRRRGLAVIFNNEIFDDKGVPERKGSSVDAIDLEKTLSLLGFEPKLHTNLTREQITHELRLLADTDHDDCDCLCIVVLSHGEAGELLHARDAIYRQCELWEPFTAKRCKTLAGKPKLFFIQACRGNNLEEHTLLVRGGAPSQTHIDSNTNYWSYTIPSRVDFLISQSTCAGYCAHPVDGSPYIQSLCRTLSADFATSDLLTMLTTVHRQVVLEFESFVEGRPDLTGLKETPSFTSTLMRSVYFRPKTAEAPPDSDQAEEPASE